MNPRARAIAGVITMSLLLVLYFVFAGVRAFALLSSAQPIAIIMGLALIILPLLGVWALVRELLFGYQATKLTDRLEAEGMLPEELVSGTASGRPIREEADTAFPLYRTAAERTPESWRAWMRLGIVYDAAGDRKRARGAIRQAISAHHDEKRASPPGN